MAKKDVVVIGGGPGGYVAAIRLGQLGKSVALIEKENVGGICLNWGCIPSKALIHAAHLYEETDHMKEVGIEVKDVQLDLEQTQKWKDGVVKQLTDGVRQLLKANKVEVVKGRAHFESSHKIRVEGANSGNETIEFESAIVATGSSPVEIPGFSFDGEVIVDSKDALGWKQAPKRMLVIGGGVIGMEMGMLYQKFGSEVTVIEMMDQLVPGVDKEIADTLLRTCKKKKINVHLSSKALGCKKNGKSIEVEFETPKKKEKAEFDVVLMSVGRKPNGSGLGLEDVGVKLERGMIPVNNVLQSNISNIYAIGDVTGPPQLAHRASKQGLVAAEVIAGKKSAYDVVAMPGAIFTDPEIGTTGLSESEAEEKGFEVHTAKFPFVASGKALASRQTNGFVKLVGDKKTGLLLGAHIIGPGASDLISEMTLALEMGATLEDVALTVHPHPTLSETLMEAAEAYLGHPVHTVVRTPRSKNEKRKNAQA